MEYYTPANGLSQRSVVGLAQDNKGFIWLSTWNGLSRFDGYQFKTYKAHPGDGCRLTSNRIPTIVTTSDDDIWCITHDQQAFLFDTRREQFIDPLYPIERRKGENYRVNRIIALRGGISWIICTEGAFRVDEKELKRATESPEAIRRYSQEEGNLPGNQIYEVMADLEGDEWVLTDRGVLIVGNKKLGEHIPFRRICPMGDHIYLTTNDNRMADYNLQDHTLAYRHIPAPCKAINDFTPLGNDTLALGTDYGVMLYLPHSQSFRHLDTTLPGISTATYAIFLDSHRQLWSTSRADGISRYDLGTGEKQHYLTPPEDIPQSDSGSRTFVYEDRQGTVWVVPRGGCLGYYDPHSRQLRPYLTDPTDPTSKFLPLIRSYIIDRQGNLWFSDRSHLCRVSFHPDAIRFRPLTAGYEVRALLTDRQGRLWVADKEGTIRIYRPDRSLQGYLTPDGRISPTPARFGYAIYHLMEDSQGHIYLGSRWDGLFRLTPRDKEGTGGYRTERFTHNPENPNSLSENSIYCLLEDREGNIWIATHGGGINLMQTDSQGYTRFIHRDNGLSRYPRNGFDRTRILHQAPDGTLMAGTTDGLITFCPPTREQQPQTIDFHTYTRIPDDPHSLSCNDVTHIYTDRRREIYVLTFSGGVNCIEPGTPLDAPRLHFNTLPNDGTPPPTDVTLSMVEDSEGDLWIVSEALLLRYHPDNHKYECFDRGSLLPDETYFSEAIPVRWQDDILLGASGGVVRLDPQAARPDRYVPPIVFTQLRLQGTPGIRPLHDVHEVKLAPRERNISIEFAALDYTDPAAIHYAYRLEGLEEEWNEAGNTRRASYANLPPGLYHLQVRSTNADGIPTDNTTSLRIEVTPTFWETPWATVLYALLFVLLATTIALIILYIYRLRHRINLEQQLANLKLRFFTDISHELRTPLTLISSPLNEVLEHEQLTPQSRQHLTLVQRNTRRMLRLVNQILDFRKIENKKMKLLLEHIEIVGLVRQVMETFRPLAEEKEITFSLDPAPESLTVWIDRDKIEKTLFNLLSNAFKYTPQRKHITIGLRMEEERLLISVCDEGIGISPERQSHLFDRFTTLPHAGLLQPSSGIGLSLVREFVELHLGTIALQSRKGEGTTFTISLPLNPESYRDHPAAEFILDESAGTDTAGTENPTIPSPASNPPSAAAEGEEAESTTLLLVEDNEELRGFLRSILAPIYRVLEATNGQEGLDLALKEQPDLVLTDVMMPVMDGLEMVKALKENRDTCHIPLIILSAKSSLDDRIEGLERGIDDYITKPFSSSYLKARIRTLLQQRRRLQAWYLEQLTHDHPATGRLAVAGLEETQSASTDVGEPSPQLSPLDAEFLTQLNHAVEQQIDNAELTIDQLAQSVGLSRTIFYQKVKGTLGLSPIDFLREKRLLYAQRLLQEGRHNVSSVAYMSGFNDPKYFSKCFKKRFGISPSQQGDSEA